MRKKSPLPTEELLHLLDAYQLGDHNALAVLLEQFEPFLRKFHRIFVRGEFNPRDPEVVLFLNWMGRGDVHETARLLKFQLRRYEKLDLWQEILVSFMEAVGGVRSSEERLGSLKAGFCYRLQIRTRELIKHQLPISIEGNPWIRELAAPEVEAQIDQDWEEGYTAGHGFENLSNFQRKLVRLIWADEIDNHILDLMERENITRENAVANHLGITVHQLKEEQERIRHAMSRFVRGKREGA